MDYFMIGALVLLAAGLFRNYRKDPGQYRKAKIVHAICLALICLHYVQSINTVISLLNNFSVFKMIFSMPVGIISGEVHLVLFLSEIVLSLMVIFISFKMTFRNVVALKWFFILLPLLFFLEVSNFYQVWVMVGISPGLSYGTSILMRYLLTGGILVSLFFIYRSHFMKEFFGLEAKAEAMEEVDVLDVNI